MNKAVLFSSGKDDWETPQALFDTLNAEFHFEMDVAASAENAKCVNYFTAADNALSKDWALYGPRTCWMNPPYSRGLQGKFIAKAAEERACGVTTVTLLPARTDTNAFHTHIYDRRVWRPYTGVEIRLLKGRVKFVGAKHGAPFPSMIVVFRGDV
jgi:phage N-6-adenine-methyltransferase